MLSLVMMTPVSCGDDQAGDGKHNSLLLLKNAILRVTDRP